MYLDISQILTQIIAFLVMLWVLKKFGWQPLLNLLHERQQKIQGDFDAIAEKEKAVQVKMHEYEEKLKGIEKESRSKIQEAVVHGKKKAIEIQEEAQKKAQEILSKAKAEVDMEVAKVKNQLKTEIVNMVISATEKVLQQKLDESTQKKLIVDFVDEVSLK